MFFLYPLLALFAASTVAYVYEAKGEHCGTSQDATLSDCEELVNDVALWERSFNTIESCQYVNPITGLFVPQFADTVACHGNCCVHVAGKAHVQDYGMEETRNEAFALLRKCADKGKNKINGLWTFGDHGICVSNKDGCADCFEDRDFTRRALREKKSIQFGREIE